MLHRAKDISLLTHTARPVRGWGAQGARKGQNRTADPNWPAECPVACGVMLSTGGKVEKRGDIQSGGVCLPKEPLCVMSTALPGVAAHPPAHGKQQMNSGWLVLLNINASFLPLSTQRDRGLTNVLRLCVIRCLRSGAASSQEAQRTEQAWTWNSSLAFCTFPGGKSF